MAGDIIFVQSYLLAPFGSSSRELHPENREQLFSRIKIAVSSVFLFACTGVVIMEAGGTTERAISQAVTKNDPILITLIESLSNCAYPFRAILILSIFMSKRTAWRKLHDMAHKNVLQLDPDTKAVRYLRRLSVILFAGTVGVHSVAITLSWMYQQDLNDIAQSRGEVPGHEASGRCYVYFGYCLHSSVLILLWTLLADLPFLLSQQILLGGVIFIVKLVRIMKDLNREIKNEIDQLGERRCGVRSERVLWNARIRRWTTTYVACQRFVRQFNAFYQWILLISVGLDILAALGLGANLVAPAEGPQDKTTVVYVTANCAFLAYATVLFIPFVQLYEEQAILTKHTPVTVSAETLCELSAIVQQNPLAIEAGGLFSFSRGYLVTVVSSVATLLIFIQEILDRSVDGSACKTLLTNSIVNHSVTLGAN
ncbi:hypothetical protein BV898_16397 [Hypsibius exemplaris]|uniref:Gustatory receptor n=1 Tax=Hypsibius exemplaris TaxID=2072580 RepID=A0A9X6RLK0_HYPEX|nr:hypothetical protein BV898_16397 [Hypsibius exemplaris]